MQNKSYFRNFKLKLNATLVAINQKNENIEGDTDNFKT